MPKKAQIVISGLEQKGFRRRDGDHIFLHLWVDDRKTAIFTKVSQGEREIGDKLLSLMARQVRLSRRDFIELVDCPLSEAEYLTMLREAGHIS